MKVCLVIVVLLQCSAVELLTFCMKLEHVNKSVYLYMLGSD